ncbi:hypothetical protein [Aquihabitans sp. McL0605]|uniref:hypothetical protein n=1 Tax=Aquihabitans sp. McL0605 TaxID=3415671 RepID=UPI003CF2274E
MRDAERWWAVAAGTLGLACFVAGALLTRAPAVDRPIEEAVTDLVQRRRVVLSGSVISITGAALLLWPLALVAAEPGSDGWRSLAVFSMAAWVFGFGFLALGSLLLIGVVWRVDGGPGPGLARALLDISHLAVWSVSAPIGALSVAATTALGVQVGRFGPAVVVAAAVKIATVVVELAGTGRQRGWNAGGWALGVSGYATVAWFALVLVALA